MKSLVYEDIRKELTDFLRAHPVFKDYNFDASGISALVNALAYNDHRFGYFAKMLLDESFVDSAHSFPAMLSHAKRLGYTARGKKAAVIAVAVTVRVTDPVFASATISCRRGTRFKASNSTADTRVFTCLDTYELVETGRDAEGKDYSGVVLLHEGTLRSIEFTVDQSVTAPSYDVTDTGLDISTLAVYATPPGGTVGTRVRMAAAPSDVNPADTVFYANYTRLDSYRVWFNAPWQHNTKLRVEFLTTSGASGNGAKIIAFVKGDSESANDINTFTGVTVVSTELSQGGSDSQGVEDIRKAMPDAWRRQYRVVTADDIRGVIAEEYGDVSAVTVWGGEDEEVRRYGKKMVCVVPKSARILSLAGRQEIRRILNAYRIPGDDIVFVDATVQLVDVEVVVKRVQSAQSDDEVRRDCITAIDRELGVSSNAAITEFSSYRLAAAVQADVPAVEYAYPAVTFYSEVAVKAAGPVRIAYGNDIHFPVTVESGGVAVAVKQIDAQTIELSASQDVQAVVRATPVVPELQALRRTYFEVRTRKARIAK